MQSWLKERNLVRKCAQATEMCFMLHSADKLYGDADFIFQQDLAPVHTAKGTKSWFNDHGVTVLDWPANSPDLNPENLDERHQTQQCRWAEDRYQSILGFITPEQCHRLIDSIYAAARSDKIYWPFSWYYFFFLDVPVCMYVCIYMCVFL